MPLILRMRTTEIGRCSRSALCCEYAYEYELVESEIPVPQLSCLFPEDLGQNKRSFVPLYSLRSTSLSLLPRASQDWELVCVFFPYGWKNREHQPNNVPEKSAFWGKFTL